ncbi:MAG: response regulator [Gammaproteobacteria bacterium]|nr:response regulator [Gammaproteobacteria bacterium]
MTEKSSRFVIIFGFGSILLLLLGLILVALNTISTTNNSLRNMVEEQNDVTHIFTMRDAAHTRSLLLYQMAAIEDRFEQEVLFEEFLAKAEDFIKARDAMLDHLSDEQQLKIWEQTSPIVTRSNRYANETIDRIIDGDLDRAQSLLLEEVGPNQNLAMEGLTQMFENQRQTIENELNSATNNSQTAYLLIASLGALAILVGFGIAVYVTWHNEQSQKDLLKQKEIAVQANHSKSAFLANISHEMRTPLTAIIGFSESLMDDNQTYTERVDSIHTVNRAGRHLLQIINDLLDLSKIEAQRLEYESIDVPLFTLIDDVISLATIQADEKGIDFDVNYVFPLPTQIQSDPVRIKQILLNLITNAIKFTDHGSVILRVSHDATARQLVFDVIDTGIGISAEKQKHLFKAFSQADTSTTRQFGGTGLGLYLSRILAQNLGGDIFLESTPNMGSTFTCRISTGNLKGVDFVYTEQGKERHGASRVISELPKLSGSILVVEDNPDNQKLINMYLNRLGVNSITVNNGREAVEFASGKNFDLILMDIQMPIMDGLQATRKLRDNGYTGPIVALSAGAMQDDLQRTEEAGCDGHLSKPIDRTAFIEKICEYLPFDDTPQTDKGVVVSRLLVEDPGMLELVQGFAKNLPEMVPQLESLLSNKEWEGLKQRMHDLKGLGGGYGYPELSQLASEIELELRHSSYDKLPEMFDDLFQLINRIMNGLPKYEPDYRVQRK